MSADQRGEWAELLDESWVEPRDVMKVDQSVVSRAAQSDGLWGMK
jgi:hypothetical protein